MITQKKAILENHSYPPEDYVFSPSEHNRNNKARKRYPSFKHLKSYNMLVLSDLCRGLFCNYCFLFAPFTASYNQLNTLVKKPLITFAKLDGQDGTLNMHTRNKYHHNAVKSGKIFLQTYLCPEKDIINQVCSQRVKQIKEKCERLRPIIESLIFCGRQNIALEVIEMMDH